MMRYSHREMGHPKVDWETKAELIASSDELQWMMEDGEENRCCRLEVRKEVI